MRELISGQVWLSNAIEVRDISEVLKAGVEAIIDVAADEPILERLPRDIVYCRFPLVDSEGNDATIIESAVSTTADFIRMKKPTLVFCSAGMSRSPCIAAAAMAMARGIDPHACLGEVVASGPSEVSPLLWREVVSLCFPDL